MHHFLIQAIITIENILTAKEFIYNLFKNHPFNFIYVKTKYLKTNYARAFDIRASQRRDKPSSENFQKYFYWKIIVKIFKNIFTGKSKKKFSKIFL